MSNFRLLLLICANTRTLTRTFDLIFIIYRLQQLIFTIKTAFGFLIGVLITLIGICFLSGKPIVVKFIFLINLVANCKSQTQKFQIQTIKLSNTTMIGRMLFLNNLKMISTKTSLNKNKLQPSAISRFSCSFYQSRKHIVPINYAQYLKNTTFHL